MMRLFYCCCILAKSSAFVPNQFSNAVRPSFSLQESTISDDLGVGIDLGTTRSAVAFLNEDGKPTIISIPKNGRALPSVVSYDNSGAVLVGQDACHQEHAYRNVKRIVGTGGKLSPEILQVVPFVVPSDSGRTYKKKNLLNELHDAQEHPTMLQSHLASDDTLIAPETISAEILRKLVDAAQDSTGRTVDRAVIGIPAYFNDAQREATERAAKIAGIPKTKLLKEPEAAALAYGIGKEQSGTADEDELVLVFDLGGGTFDVSILLVGGGITEIICTSGNSNLGGSDFDARIAEHLMGIVNDQGDVHVKKWPVQARNAVVRAAEQIRIHLSNSKSVHLRLPTDPEEWTHHRTDKEVIVEQRETEMETNDNPSHILYRLTRVEMENLCKDDFQALLRPIREVAIMAGALLPGDSSPTVVQNALEMDEMVLQGKSKAFVDFYEEEEEPKADQLKTTKREQQEGRRRARELAKEEKKYRQERKKLESLDRRTIAQARNDGVKIRDGISGRPISRIVLVGGATRMPAIGRLLESITGTVPQRTVNPDEAVALGCAVHVGVLDGVEGMGTVLNPLQAAILKAVAMKESLGDGGGFNDDDDDEFDSEVLEIF